MVKMAALGTEPQPGSGVMTTIYMNLGLTDQSEDKVVICNGSNVNLWKVPGSLTVQVVSRKKETTLWIRNLCFISQTRSSVYLRETKWRNTGGYKIYNCPTCRGSPALAPSSVGENHGLKIFSQITWWGGDTWKQEPGRKKKRLWTWRKEQSGEREGKTTSDAQCASVRRQHLAIHLQSSWIIRWPLMNCHQRSPQMDQ